jgi:hypothetical protein
VRVVLKGIHKVKARLASGESKTYFYAWRGGPQIRGKLGTPAFVSEYNDAHASLRQPRAGTFMTIITQYKAAPEFTGLAESTRRAYLAYIKLIEDEFGDLPVAARADRRVRGELRHGEIGLRIHRARRTTPGRPWRGSCRLRRTAASS